MLIVTLATGFCYPRAKVSIKPNQYSDLHNSAVAYASVQSTYQERLYRLATGLLHARAGSCRFTVFRMLIVRIFRYCLNISSNQAFLLTDRLPLCISKVGIQADKAAMAEYANASRSEGSKILVSNWFTCGLAGIPGLQVSRSPPQWSEHCPNTSLDGTRRPPVLAMEA